MIANVKHENTSFDNKNACLTNSGIPISGRCASLYRGFTISLLMYYCTKYTRFLEIIIGKKKEKLTCFL